MTMKIIGGFQKNNKLILEIYVCNDTSIYEDYVVKFAIYLYHYSLYSLRDHNSNRRLNYL